MGMRSSLLDITGEREMVLKDAAGEPLPARQRTQRTSKIFFAGCAFSSVLNMDLICTHSPGTSDSGQHHHAAMSMP